ncbi:uncharacterized protein DEA37_0002389 [Paragonimus westermani]|uniref:Uncharacterized protein n=1 Tax=Paragonimus westermani TaxID=34504 RepID=A0A5J4NT89_9TREM|nr:uncharacterized protein DEA37_0002389 [Paragonimus westermani]
MLQLVYSIWQQKETTREFKDALTLRVFKGKGSEQCPDISLPSSTRKELTKIVLSRLNADVAKTNVPVEQRGLRASLSPGTVAVCLVLGLLILALIITMIIILVRGHQRKRLDQERGEIIPESTEEFR